jgi:excisionase family DNA binding protein
MTDDTVERSRLLLTIPQVCERLQLGRSSIYLLIADGRLATLRFGRAVRVPLASVEQLIRERLAEAG